MALTAPDRRWLPPRAIGLLSVAIVFAGFVLGTPTSGEEGLSLVLVGLGVMACAWTVGRAVRERRAFAERSAAQLAEQAVTQECLRIARELHDVVAHSMGVIAVKAGVANHLLRSRPDDVQEALATIEATSRSALAEMRHMLGVLRAEAGEGPPGELRPAPGLAGLPALAEQTRAADAEVDLAIEGAEGMPEGLELSVYRIVQEALTNVIRHAAPAHARVLVLANGRDVLVEVSDDGGRGPRRCPSASGHGLIGMRERVALYGGEFRAGPRPQGGFEVRARLPYQPQDTVGIR